MTDTRQSLAGTLTASIDETSDPSTYTLFMIQRSRAIDVTERTKPQLHSERESGTKGSRENIHVVVSCCGHIILTLGVPQLVELKLSITRGKRSRHRH